MNIFKLLTAAKKQNFPKGEYAIFGSATLAVRHLREAPNLDIIVTNKLWDELLHNRHKPDEEGFIRIGQLKISNWWFAPTRKSLSTLISEAEEINGLPFVQLAEVRDYKANVNRPKDINDVALIDQFLANLNTPDEPIGLGLPSYQPILDLFIEAIKTHLQAKSILTLIVFGSVARGEAKGSSDIDVFVFFDDQILSRSEVTHRLTTIIYDLRQTAEYKALQGKNILPEIYPFLISKKSTHDTLWVFLDALEDGKIIFDMDNFGANLISQTKTKIQSIGGRRTNLPNGKKCWVLWKSFDQVIHQTLAI